MAAPVPGRCGFFVERKKRFCKMIVGKGRRFCGEHAAMEEGVVIRRIVCPLDPKHTVSEDKLEKHLKKCNSREKPKPVYFVKDRNAGSDDEAEITEVSLSQRSRTELESLLDKLKAAAEGLQCELEEKVLSHEALQDELDNPKNGESAQKHLRQQASILAHMAALGLLAGGRCFVEFGAGRGKLSHWIHQALKDEPELQLLLVERSSTRFKVDGKHVDAGAEFERLQVDIQHLDLSRVPLLREKRLPVVGVGKHLCGAATDLALRCLLEEPRESIEPPPKRLRSDPDSDPALPCPPAEPRDPALPCPPAEPRDPALPCPPAEPRGPALPCPPAEPRDPAQPCPPAEPRDPALPCPPAEPRGPDSPAVAVIGLTVALCCHHRCEWRHYVGKDFFRRRGLGAGHFFAFSRMSSWATCGLRPTNHSAPTPDPTNHSAPTPDPTNHSAPTPDPTNHSAPTPDPPDPTNQRGEEDEHEPAEDTDTVTGFLSPSERERVGRLCKLLIDCGRVDYLQNQGFSGRLSRYISSDVTLENVLLTAVPSTPAHATHT